jgi:hypothetical protein
VSFAGDAVFSPEKSSSDNTAILGTPATSAVEADRISLTPALAEIGGHMVLTA